MGEAVAIGACVGGLVGTRVGAGVGEGVGVGVRTAGWFRCSLNKQMVSGNRVWLILNREAS